MNLNLKLLQTFLLIAEHGSFRKAAEASNRTTSAVSMQLKSLEEQAGVALFRRTSHNVELTPEGERLLVKARLALSELDSGLKELREAALQQRGLVTLASSPSVASTFLPKVLVTFGAENPGIVVRVQEMRAEEILRVVREQTVDFGVCPIASQPSDFDCAALLTDELCVLVPKEHPFAKKSRVPIRALQGSSCVALSSSSALRQVIDAAAKEAHVTLNVQYEVRQIPTLITMVAAGLGIGIAPSISLAFVSEVGLRAIPLTQPAIRRNINVITLKGRILPGPVKQLMRALARSAPEVSGRVAR